MDPPSATPGRLEQLITYEHTPRVETWWKRDDSLDTSVESPWLISDAGQAATTAFEFALSIDALPHQLPGPASLLNHTYLECVRGTVQAAAADHTGLESSRTQSQWLLVHLPLEIPLPGSSASDREGRVEVDSISGTGSRARTQSSSIGDTGSRGAGASSVIQIVDDGVRVA